METEERQNRGNGFNQRNITVERIFIITNLVLELPSAVLDQLSAEHKPRYALISMIMSSAIMLVSILDLVRLGKKERVRWMIRGLKPWFYSPYPSFKPLGTFADVVGLVCAIFQFVFATIVYVLLSANPIKISVWPVIFAIGVLFSRFPRKQQKISVLERIEIAQRTLDGLQPHEVAMLFEDENYNELSEILERGKKRAETARLRELHTLKGQVESKVKLKGLDVGIIQRQYSV